MSDTVIIPLPGIGTLELPADVYRRALRPIEAPAMAKPAQAVAQPATGLVDAKAAALALSLPVSWIREKARQGEIPCEKAGRYVRFDLAAVRRALAATDHGSFGRR